MSKDIDLKPGDEVPENSGSSAQDICPTCAGSGRVEGRECQDCAGTGYVEDAVGGG